MKINLNLGNFFKNAFRLTQLSYVITPETGALENQIYCQGSDNRVFALGDGMRISHGTFQARHQAEISKSKLMT